MERHSIETILFDMFLEESSSLKSDLFNIKQEPSENEKRKKYEPKKGLNMEKGLKNNETKKKEKVRYIIQKYLSSNF